MLESPNSGLAFRRELYRPEDDGKAVADCLALAGGHTARAFREPLRFWARKAGSGIAVPVTYQPETDSYPEPIKGSLVIYIEGASLKSV